MKRELYLGMTIGLGILAFSSPSTAQVASDGTLPTPTLVPPSVNSKDFLINNGTRSGNNLFHSFSQFSVPTNGSAIFNNATDVQNIFSRVTGSQISNINGTLKTQGNASLFLMNPNGIVFGPNAQLQLGGSFLGTTASGIKFEDGLEFNSVNATPALLSVKVPIGLQMGQNPGAMQVNGSGHNLSSQNVMFAPYLPTGFSLSGLRVKAGKTIALVGGEVALNGGGITAPGGRIEVAGVGSGQVGISQTPQGFALNDATVSEFKNIQMSQRSLLDVGTLFDPTGRSAGSIQVQGNNIRLSEGSLLLSQQRSLRNAGDVTVRATGSLEVLGTTPNETISSGIISDALGLGASANLKVSAQGLVLNNGGLISSRSFGVAPTGTIAVNATDFIEMSGVSPKTNVFSVLSTLTLNNTTPLNPSVKAGNVRVSTGRLSMRDGASIAAIALGYGSAGDIVVNTDTTEMIGGLNYSGATRLPQPTSILSISYLLGNSGTLMLNTRALTMRNGAVMSTTNLGVGNSGSLAVNASESIQMSSQFLVDNGYTTIASTLGDRSGRQIFNRNSPVNGNAGDVTVNTPVLQLNQAGISVGNYGIGSAGTLKINANWVNLKNSGSISAETSSGEGGNITLNSQALLLQNLSAIVTNAAGRGSGGNITINSPVIVGVGNSDIIANAKQGRGGNIQITAQSILGLEFRNLLNPRAIPTNDITASSEFGINGNVQVNTIGINPANALNSLPIDVVDSSRQIADRCASAQTSSFISTGRGGIPQTPMKHRTTDRPWSDMRSNSLQTAAMVKPIAENPHQPIVEATAIQIDETGAIALIMPQPRGRGSSETCGIAGSIGAL